VWLRGLGLGLAGAAILGGHGRALADESWGLQLFGGAHLTSEDSGLGDGGGSHISSYVQLGPRLWQRMAEWASLEGEIPLGVTKSDDQVSTLFLTMPRMHARVTALSDAKVSPFAVIGGGVPIVVSQHNRAVKSDILGAGYAGFGLDIKLGRLGVRLEGRAVGMPGAGDRLFVSEYEALISFSLADEPHPELLPTEGPKVDTDGDTVPDADDHCPDAKEDLDGFEDGDGCPELDNDGDQVLDGLDRCPDQMETHNGYKDGDGCPDEVVKEVRLLEGVVSGLRFDAGSAVMDEAGFSELDKVVSLMREQTSIRIEVVGHTDDRESEDLEALSTERAQSVRQYLVEAGIGPGRIFGRGEADRAPVADNDTRVGRRSNRRVEIRICTEGRCEEDE
jgi:outer membrane protein OmpA-like peptidoglycan-associated protein